MPACPAALSLRAAKGWVGHVEGAGSTEISRAIAPGVQLLAASALHPLRIAAQSYYVAPACHPAEPAATAVALVHRAPNSRVFAMMFRVLFL
jgi:hypothetical protein